MNEWDIITSSNVMQTGIKFDASAYSIDYLVRLSGSCLEDMEFKITSTEKFKRHFTNIFDYFRAAKDTLVEVILSQKKSLDYNGFYNAFLMEQLSEEEFTKIANQFTYQPKSIDIRLLASKINILFDLTTIDYSISELADIFQCNANTVADAIQLIGTNNFLREPQ